VRIMSPRDVTKIVRTGNIHAFSDYQPGPTTLAELEKILQDPSTASAASAAHIRAQSAGTMRGKSFDDIYRTRRDSAFGQTGGAGNSVSFQSHDMMMSSTGNDLLMRKSSAGNNDMLMRKNSANNSNMLLRKNSASNQSFRRSSHMSRKGSQAAADLYDCEDDPPLEPLTLITPEALAQFDRLPPNFGKTLDRILGVPIRQVGACRSCSKLSAALCIFEAALLLLNRALDVHASTGACAWMWYMCTHTKAHVKNSSV
jgi:hypothetical protein